MASLPQPTIDAILSRHAKNLKPGQSLTFTLIKGPTTTSSDPIAAKRAAAAERAAASAQSAHNTASAAAAAAASKNLQRAAAAAPFPRVAKFIETVERPDFGKKLRDGRMYEEDVPKVKDESDDEEEAKAAGENGDSANPSSAKPRKKKWRRNDPPKRHWILQEKSEFREKMEAKRRRKIDPKAAAEFEDSSRISSRYEGLPEYNTSQYVLLTVGPTVPPNEMEEDTTMNGGEPTKRVPEQLMVTPVFGVTSFAQPAKLKTYSMHEAEAAISNQRANMTRFMMHGKMSKENPGGAAPVGRVGVAALGPPPKGGMAKARLLGKLVGKSTGDDDVEGDDDVMKDIAFRERKGGSAKARKELLDSMAGEGVTVDADGVLGGVNDSEFGGRRRFGRLANPTKKAKEDSQGTPKGGAATKEEGEKSSGAAGNDGLAMDEDFYQRDVGAEYEDMDYDANEQFDDDDVEIGETEIADEGGFAGDIDEEEDDEEFDEEELVGGIATSSGLKAMLAKARGETVPEEPSATAAAAAAAARDADTQAKKSTAYNYDDVPGGAGAPTKDRADEEKSGKAPAPVSGSLGQVAKAAKRAKAEAEEQAKANAEKTEPKYTGVEVDENGQRLITLEAIRREIWLHHGAIKSKRLMRIFDSTKKAPPARQNRFKEVVRELCTIKQDTVEGNLLVLKQHYSNMG